MNKMTNGNGKSPAGMRGRFLGYVLMVIGFLMGSVLGLKMVFVGRYKFSLQGISAHTLMSVNLI